MSTIEAPAQPVVQPVTRADVLHRAADLLEEFGWCQGASARDKNGNDAFMCDTPAASYCLVGAIGRAQGDFGASPSGSSSLWDAAWASGPLGFDDRCPDMVSWNDEPGRTKAEVVARLRAAANTSPQ